MLKFLRAFQTAVTGDNIIFFHYWIQNNVFVTGYSGYKIQFKRQNIYYIKRDNNASFHFTQVLSLQQVQYNLLI